MWTIYAHAVWHRSPSIIWCGIISVNTSINAIRTLFDNIAAILCMYHIRRISPHLSNHMSRMWSFLHRYQVLFSRTPIDLARDTSVVGRQLRVPVLQIVGTTSAFIDATVDVMSKLDPSNSNWMKVRFTIVFEMIKNHYRYRMHADWCSMIVPRKSPKRLFCFCKDSDTVSLYTLNSYRYIFSSIDKYNEIVKTSIIARWSWWIGGRSNAIRIDRTFDEQRRR